MSAELEHWLAWQRRYYADLVENDDGLPDHFDDLARRSDPHVDEELPWTPEWSAYSAYTPSTDFAYGLPSELRAEWIGYAELWEIFRERNPRIAIAEIMSEISQRQERSPFPRGWEDSIRTWVQSNFCRSRPFSARTGLDTREFRERFSALAKTAGQGWVYYDEDDDRLVWREDDER